jgi:hypothetical protein
LTDASLTPQQTDLSRCRDICRALLECDYVSALEGALKLNAEGLTAGGAAEREELSRFITESISYVLLMTDALESDHLKSEIIDVVRRAQV